MLSTVDDMARIALRLKFGVAVAAAAIVAAMTSMAAAGVYLAPPVVTLPQNLPWVVVGDYHGAVTVRDYDGNCNDRLVSTRTITADGRFTLTYQALTVGRHAVQAEGDDGSRSFCMIVDVYPTPGGATADSHDGTQSVFACYSRFGVETLPAVVARDRLDDGWWSPVALLGDVAGGDNLGGFHLVCNPSPIRHATGRGVDGSGDTYTAATGLYAIVS